MTSIMPRRSYRHRVRQLTYCFLRLANFDSGVFERLNRYEAALWHRLRQVLGFAFRHSRERVPVARNAAI